MKLFALVAATVNATPVEGSCEPQQGWNCMYPHHKHGAVCFKSCSEGSSGKHEQNAYKECHCKSHNNCEWVELSHCRHPHTTTEPQTEAQATVDPVESAIESMFNIDDVIQMDEPVAEEHHNNHHHKHQQMANDAVAWDRLNQQMNSYQIYLDGMSNIGDDNPYDVPQYDEPVAEAHHNNHHHKHHQMANDAVAMEETEEVVESEELAEVTTEAPTTQAPTTTTVSMTNCRKPKHHWECDNRDYTDGTSCKRECFKGAGFGLGVNKERQQSCNCGENGCYWIVTSDCSHFHNQVYKAELATLNAKNHKSCERKPSEWNCSHDYIHTQGTLCVKECDASFGLSDDFHAISECHCHHDECEWTELSSCE